MDFKKIMSSKSDLELLKITTSKEGDYIPDAMAAASAILEERNLDDIKISQLKKELTSESDLKRKGEKGEMNTRLMAEANSSLFIGSE